jgi:N-acetylmuramic acid 6-phosphate etherase
LGLFDLTLAPIRPTYQRMSEASNRRSDEFLKISDQFQLGVLTTETSHPVTANLSEAARAEAAEGVRLLFEADRDVLKTYRQFVASGRAGSIQDAVVKAVQQGGKVFFTGCGSTGRLSIQLVSIWRDFWQRRRAEGMVSSPAPKELEHRAFSVMAGGDFALIKSVEGFEDFTAFGKRQIGDLGVKAGDVVFAITEGGETSFVIGTAWKGLEAGAKVYFVYNNPDDLLCKHVTRSREVIEEPRIEKINLTTGPMSITGSTRMQATTIQLCVLLTVMEMAFRQLLRELNPDKPGALDPATVPQEFEHYLSQMHAALQSADVCAAVGRLVALEEGVYRSGHKNNYYADRFGIDMLTDTTERSPTYCTPPFRKFDDVQATESWAYLFVPQSETAQAWRHIIKRDPKCVEWTEAQVRELVGEEKTAKTYEIVRKISSAELMRFKVGLDGLAYRHLGIGDSAVGLVAEAELESLLAPSGFHRQQLEAASRAGAKIGILYFGSVASLDRVRRFVAEWNPQALLVAVAVPQTGFLLDGVTRAGVKMLLNTLSTCTMVRLGRVMGNYMIWVVASNLKLIDRATRYIQRLTNLDYQAANRLLFEVVEYVEPRMKADQTYPPVVGVSVMRARHGLSNEDAEKRILAELQG